MKKIIILLLTGLSLFSTPAASAIGYAPVTLSTATKQNTVFVTKTGSKYHTSDYRYLKQSKIKTTKKEAITNGYAACKVCKP